MREAERLCMLLMRNIPTIFQWNKHINLVENVGESDERGERYT